MSADQIAAAEILRKLGKDFGQIAHILGLHINTVRSKLDQSYMEALHENMRKTRERALSRSTRLAREQAARSTDTRDLTALFFGDPPLERSALGAKLRKRTE